MAQFTPTTTTSKQREQKLREAAAQRSKAEQRKVKALTERLDQIEYREFLTTSKTYLENKID